MSEEIATSPWLGRGSSRWQGG